jgi:hypothetical protein
MPSHQQEACQFMILIINQIDNMNSSILQKFYKPEYWENTLTFRQAIERLTRLQRMNPALPVDHR